MDKIGKNKNLQIKFRYRAIQICQRQGCISSPLQMKNRITIWALSHIKEPESKFDLNYCSLTIPGHVPVKKVWPQHWQILRL